MKHAVLSRKICICNDCDGIGRVFVGRRGPNDPDVYEIQCPECEGLGEVYVQPRDEDDEEDAECA